jgi:hypothetical protein
MRAKTPRWTLILATLTLAAAASPIRDALRLKPESKLWFEGTSTVRDWNCKAPQIEAAIDAAAGAPAAVLAGKKR